MRIQHFCTLCIIKRLEQAPCSLLHLTGELPSIQHCWEFSATECRKTMLIFTGDILFINVSPHPPLLCQTLLPRTQRHSRTPCSSFLSTLIQCHTNSLCLAPLDHPMNSGTLSWVPCLPLKKKSSKGNHKC